MSESPITFEMIDYKSGVCNGSILYKGQKAGHVQFNFGFKPKRVGNLVRKLRELGIVVNFPNEKGT